MNASAALHFLAEASSQDLLSSTDTEAFGIRPWWFLLIFVLILVHAFFVLSEYCIRKVLVSQVDEVAEERNGSAKMAKRILARLDQYVIASQLGIAVSSLALGILVVKTVAGIIYHNPLTDEVSASWAYALALTIGLITAALTLLVLGELVPRALAIRNALNATLAISKPLTAFYRIARPFVWICGSASDWILKRIFKVEPVSEAEIFHTADELKHLVSVTERGEEVTEIERKILVNALELNDRVARDVMLPRADVIWLDLNKDFETNLKKAVDSQHTRFPLVDGHLDHPQGLVHIKDLIKISREDSPDLMTIKRKLEHVPELMPLDSLLEVFLTNRAHMALVVDEYGGSVGIITLDNVLEELVGDIQDEFDSEEEEELYFSRIDDHAFSVDGTLALYELADYTDLDLEDPEVSTIGGYVTHQLGHLPEIGEEIQIEGYIAKVLESDGKSVGKLEFQRTPEAIAAIEEMEDEEEGVGVASREDSNGSEEKPEG